MATMLYRVVELRDCRGKVTWVTVNVADDKEADGGWRSRRGIVFATAPGSCIAIGQGIVNPREQI